MTNRYLRLTPPKSLSETCLDFGRGLFLTSVSHSKRQYVHFTTVATEALQIIKRHSAHDAPGTTSSHVDRCGLIPTALIEGGIIERDVGR
jgi:hypothetical protein